MKKCQACMAVLSDKAKFCDQCSEKAATYKVCLKCSKKMSLNSNFCDECGKRLIEENPFQQFESNSLIENRKNINIYGTSLENLSLTIDHSVVSEGNLVYLVDGGHKLGNTAIYKMEHNSISKVLEIDTDICALNIVNNKLYFNNCYKIYSVRTDDSELTELLDITELPIYRKGYIKQMIVIKNVIYST